MEIVLPYRCFKRMSFTAVQQIVKENAVQKSSEQKFNALASLELEHSFLRILYVLAVIVVEEQ